MRRSPTTLTFLVRRGDDGDLTDLEYHDHPAFARAQSAGYDGVIINDFAQTNVGNFGHVSCGINANGLRKLDFLRIDATHYPLANGSLPRTTPAVETFLASIQDQRPALVPG